MWTFPFVLCASSAEFRLVSGDGKRTLYSNPYSKNSCKYALADCDGLTGGKQCDHVRICTLGYKRGNGFCQTCTFGFILLGICTGIFPPWNLLESDACRKENAKTDKSSFQIHIAVCVLALCRLWCLCLSEKAVCSYMFLQVQFVFFDYGESAALFFADYLSVMCLFAVIGHYVSDCMNCLNRKRK